MLGDDLQIGWDSVPGAERYNLFHSPDPLSGFTLLQANIGSTSWLHLGGASGPRGFYRVTAHDDR
ncbi:MAG: hypothetical protein K0B87_06135 [Candidatus Syntrophosphaera sp.]|nr:hypothetical protein [Candidatus Syntrophosphaera sp.]